MGIVKDVKAIVKDASCFQSEQPVDTGVVWAERWCRNTIAPVRRKH